MFNNMILPELENKPYLVDLQREYETMFCPIEAVEELVEFIDIYWRKKHPLVVSRELLDWQHLNKANSSYNFVISRHRKSKQIHAILGFVPTSQFDSNIQHPQVWACIWKKRDDINVKGIGVGLYHFLVNNIEIESMSMLGVSEIARDIYQSWNFTSGVFSHFFMLNKMLKEYKLIDGYIPCEPQIFPVSSIDCLIELCTQSDFESLDLKLFEFFSKQKSKDYYINRFFQHPIYTYNAYSIKKHGEMSAVFFIRECSNECRKALRIVDFVGDLQALIGNAGNFQKLLSERSAEYIDFFHVGLDKGILEASGFVDKSNTSLVVPNYFEPFYMRNIEIGYTYKNIDKNEQAVFFKADADQDRPNLI